MLFDKYYRMSMFASCTIQRTKTGILRNNRQVCIIFNWNNPRFQDVKEKWNFIIPVRVDKLKYF